MTRLELLPALAPEAERIWRSIEDIARPGYFLTWGWIENWLACLPRGEAPQLAIVREGDRPVAACMLGRRLILRHGVVPSRAVFVNATGLPARDDLTIEHNGFIQRPGTQMSLADLANLLPRDWDEIFLPAVDASAFTSLEAGHHHVLVDREVPVAFVDLEAVRASGDYLALLGKKTRGQIRRARRDLGTLDIAVATDVASAYAIYDELVALHSAQWNAKHEPGAFADPWIDHFHRRLIQQRHHLGEIQLLRVRAGNQVVGCTYSLIANGRVYVYQSGFAQFDDPHIKPGYVCHAAGVELAADAGHAIYDPLGGDARYKESLSTNTDRLVWLRIQRRLSRFAIESKLRDWKHARDAANSSHPPQAIAR
jgi:hypothetical protein